MANDFFVDILRATSPASDSMVAPLAYRSEMARLEYARNWSRWFWLSPENAPIATIVDETTQYQFQMQGTGTPSVELPYRIGEGVGVVEVKATIAVALGTSIGSVGVHAQTETLIDAVSSSTLATGRVGSSAGSIPSSAGWRGRPNRLWTFGVASMLVAPQSLVTSRIQAITVHVDWLETNDNVYDSAAGDDTITMSLPVYLVSVEARDVRDGSVQGG